MDTQTKLQSEKPGMKVMAETIRQLAHRHLKDPNHTTSDEELRYAKVELTGSVEQPETENLYEIDNTPIFPPFPGESTTYESEEKNNRVKNSAPPNPYNIYS